ncbi:fatty acid desaturase [Aquirufa ecclesiirivi]|uniref:fatty acid desaturase n=1 Tax=Aquirufa ecclesiirivi TaxID=2715124 RepID=UPI0022A84682|nr:fatty acid desaturase [Aquirufa ecclesiirivi]MCZ2472632.1 fatty acid desaturase [Aquirufa ecclesiirivi]
MKKYTGIFSAGIIILLWMFHLAFWIQMPLDWKDPFTYLAILIQTHLYTGLFISSHDAIHGVVSKEHPLLNHAIGRFCATLFAFNNYTILRKKHHHHHAYVNTSDDPDVHQGNFFIWWFKFMFQYVHWTQILAMAIAYNVLKIWFPMENIILFWELPAILATLQLFYFGTYLPHRGEHETDNKHQSRSQEKNHIWAFLSCYNFGYHYEHHDKPYLPWWKLAEAKEQNSQISSR